MRLIVIYISFLIAVSSCSIKNSPSNKEKIKNAVAKMTDRFYKDKAYFHKIAGKIKTRQGDTICDIAGGWGFNSSILALYLPNNIFFEEDISKKDCNKRKWERTFKQYNPKANITNYNFFIGTEKTIPFANNSLI